MKTWRRADRWLPCGSDPFCRIDVGDPYLELAGDGWKKVRCARHANSPAPERIDEPEAVTHRRSVSSFSPSRELAGTVRIGPKLLKFAQASVDVRVAQAHEDPNG